MTFGLALAAVLMQPMPCGDVREKPVPACAPDRRRVTLGRGELPDKEERDGVFRRAGILPLVQTRGLDQVDRDLLFMAARAAKVEHLEAQYPWLSAVQIDALVREAAVEAHPSCVAPPRAAEVFWIGEREVRPGETIELTPAWTDHPGSFEPVPDECVAELTISAGAPAVLLASERKLQVLKDASHGALFTVGAKVGDRKVNGELRVIVPSAAPLVGTWTQESISCASDTLPQPGSIHSRHKPPVRELSIRGDGTFSVTWIQPFESYRDYWGVYQWDEGSGAVEFSVSDGNNIPRSFDGSGIASRIEHRLVLTDVDFGQREDWPPATACQVTFVNR